MTRRKIQMALVIGIMTAGVFTSNLHAQVTIGSGIEPHPAALLDLKQSNTDGTANSSKGMLLPRVELTDDPTVFALSGSDQSASAVGMWVWNTNPYVLDGAGTYQWNGVRWWSIVTGGQAPPPCTPTTVSGYDPVTRIITITTVQTTTLKITSADASSYLWYKTNAISETGTPITDATNNTYTTPTLAAGTHYYYCEATGCGTVQSAVFTITVLNPGALQPNAAGATFGGKNSFDIAYTNDGTGVCGTLANNRANRKTVFANRRESPQAPTDWSENGGVHIYTFKPPYANNVSNVRFGYEELGGAVGLAIDSIVPAGDYSGVISGECSLTVYYKTSLDEDLRGKTRDNAWRVKLFAVYNNAAGDGADRRLETVVRLQDCSSCGAKISASEWREFMCYNLGADETQPPFVYSTAIEGGLFQWGRPADGHQIKNSPVEDGYTALADYNPLLDTSFYLPTDMYADWLSDDSDSANPNFRIRWNDGAKGYLDPCPIGWRVPSHSQWLGVIANNGTTWSSGKKVGDALFLPAAGSRGNGYYSTPHVYWSSTYYSQERTYLWNILYNNTEDSGMRFVGGSVRCVADVQ